MYYIILKFLSQYIFIIINIINDIIFDLIYFDSFKYKCIYNFNIILLLNVIF